MRERFDSKAVSILWLDVRGCAAFGRRELEAALGEHSAVIREINHWSQVAEGETVLIVGTTTNRRVQMLLAGEGVDCNIEPESTVLWHCEIPGGTALVAAGSDEKGLMYNLLELARRVKRHGADALNKAENLLERPQNRVRCVDRYLVGHLDDEWFKSEDFWHYLLARMAKSRFNRFCLILGFDTAYMSPPYPFFVPVDGYPDIRVKNLTAEGMAENLRALRRVGALCHEYGMEFVFATWQQRPWTTDQDRLVEGLPNQVAALGDYCYSGLKALITAVPEMDIVQFRVNHESGVGDQVSAADFWNHCTDAVADAADETGRPLILDLRAKGLTDAMIDHAFSRGLPVEVPTKYWCEHAALPHHITVMRSEELDQLDNFNHSRRYSYADMLRRPRYFDVIYRLWNYGSTNLFLWGDADYARRFSLSCGMSDSAGFQINTPLALKYGHELSHKEAWPTFRDPALRYGRWEDERFWMWYTAYGRLGYNPDTDPAVWREEFADHFGGKNAVPLERALAAASKIVPMITTVHMPVHPSLRYWPELNTGWALFYENNLNQPAHYDWQENITYGSSEPSDHGLFYGVDEYVKDLAAGTLRGKYSPLQSAKWLEDMAADAMAALDGAERTDAPEFLALEADIRMLGDLARYHAQKLRAATALALWRERGEGTYLSDAALLLDKAITHWKALAEKGERYYHHDLDFSSAGSKTRRGTWANLTCELEADRNTLSALLKENGITLAANASLSYEPRVLSLEHCQMAADFPECAPANKDLRVTVRTAAFDAPSAAPMLHYRHTDQTEGLFRTAPMEFAAGGYSAIIPADYLTGDYDLQLYVTVQGSKGTCAMLPGIYHPIYPYPYHVVTITKEETYQ